MRGIKNKLGKFRNNVEDNLGFPLDGELTIGIYISLFLVWNLAGASFLSPAGWAPYTEANAAAAAGSAWIEGAELHWADGNVEYRIDSSESVIETTSPAGSNGALWVEGSNIHWIDQNGDERYYGGGGNIVNGDFSNGDWTGWNRNPGDHWMAGWPDDGSCQTPADNGDGICSYPASTVSVLSSGSGDAVCSPGSGCPTPVLGDGNLNLDGASDGGFNGNIFSDTYTVPSGSDVNLNFWVNLDGRSSDGGRYDGNTRFYGTSSSYSATEGEGVYWAVMQDNGCNGPSSGDTEIAKQYRGGDNYGSNPTIQGTQRVDLSSYSGQCVYLYTQINNAGGGDDGLIQVDDVYWGDSSGNRLKPSGSAWVENGNLHFVNQNGNEQFSSSWREIFAEGNLNEWSVDSSNFQIKTNAVYSGSYSAGAEVTDGQTNMGSVSPNPLSTEVQVDEISFRYYETSSSHGGGIGFYDSAGNIVAGYATDNPQWVVWDGSSWNQIYNGDGYGRWVEVTYTFDWANGQYDYRIRDPSSGIIKTGTAGLGNTNGIQTLYVKNDHTFDGTSSFSTSSASNFYMWFDAINVEW